MGNAFGSDTIKPMETIAVPDSFYPILEQFTKGIIKMDLQKLVLHPISNPLLQTLLLVLHMKDQSLCMKLCKAVMSQIDMLKNKTDTRKPNTDDNHQNTKDKRYTVYSVSCCVPYQRRLSPNSQYTPDILNTYM